MGRFRRTHDVRLRERYHTILLLMDGKSCPEIAQWLYYTRLGIEYCRERVGQLLHALGFRWRRLRHRHLKVNPEEQAAFRAELEELLVEWPADRELLFINPQSSTMAERLAGSAASARRSPA